MSKVLSCNELFFYSQCKSEVSPNDLSVNSIYSFPCLLCSLVYLLLSYFLPLTFLPLTFSPLTSDFPAQKKVPTTFL